MPAAPAPARPATAREAGELVRAATAVRIVGRCTEPGGHRPAGLVLDTTALAGVVDYPARDMTVTVRAGTAVADLTVVLAGESQRLPVDLGDGTLGGAVASNRSGPRRLGFGTLRDYLIGCRFLTPDGQEAAAGGRVVKNVAGYDLMKLHAGAFGTLGLLTELTFKVVPRPEDTAVVLFGLNPAALGPTLDRLHASASRPVAVEVYNRAAAEGRLPVAEPWVLAVGFEEKAETVGWQVETLLSELKSAPARGTVAFRGADAGLLWGAMTRRPTGDELLLAGAARPSRIADVLLSPALANDRVSASGLVGTFAVESVATTATSAGEQLLALRAAAGDGHVSVRRRPAEWDAWVPPAAPSRGDHALMLAVKRALDPTDKFNPGRQWPG